MDEHLADLVEIIRIFALFRITTLEKKIEVALPDGESGVALNFFCDTQYLTDFAVQGALFTEKDVAVVGSVEGFSLNSFSKVSAQRPI